MAEDLQDPAVPNSNGGLSDAESDRVIEDLEMEMEELDKLEETSAAPPTPKTNITHPTEDKPRTDLPSSPLASRGTRVWETHRPSSQDFVIWEDTPEDQEAAEAAADDNYIDVPDEDKENMTPTTSEEDEAEQEQTEHDTERQTLVDWTQAGLGRHDTFGLPPNHDMALFVNDDRNILLNTARPAFRRRRRLRTTEDDSSSDDAQQSVMQPEMLQLLPLITADRQRRPAAERTPLGVLDTM
ncbi:hypothetical protein N7474_001093 [Penicillium riverlandense]|uniref:uncharacterized protein n=1 Tax=Penicillium riverlandense TaxID=1903569 RepID=UPI00254843AC|nr:uncharacterized protein N7474_001093 [Penicillium riverlandense]KAJ5832782.1 hypothetical protein N7474_001093 [Penicillium riverlandense]